MMLQEPSGYNRFFGATFGEDEANLRPQINCIMYSDADCFLTDSHRTSPALPRGAQPERRQMSLLANMSLVFPQNQETFCFELVRSIYKLGVGRLLPA